MTNLAEHLPSLYAAISACVQHIKTAELKKKPKSTEKGGAPFPYFPASSMVHAAREAFQANNLIVLPEYSLMSSERNNSSVHSLVQGSFRIIHIPTGANTTVVTLADGVDSQDKGLAKAQTFAYKKMLEQLLMIVESVDSDDPEAKALCEAPAPPQAARQAAPAPTELTDDQQKAFLINKINSWVSENKLRASQVSEALGGKRSVTCTLDELQLAVEKLGLAIK
jgi:hypothetical protein